MRRNVCRYCGRPIHTATTQDNQTKWVHDKRDPFRHAHAATPTGLKGDGP